MKKPRFRKGKKASRRVDWWLKHFGFENEDPMTPKQMKLAMRYIGAINRFNARREQAVKIAMTAVTAALGAVQARRIIEAPIRKDGTEKQQHLLRAMALAQNAIETANAVARAFHNTVGNYTLPNG